MSNEPFSEVAVDSNSEVWNVDSDISEDTTVDSSISEIETVT